MFNERLGCQAGLDVGMADWVYGFQAPRNAFGTKTGEGDIAFKEGFDKYLYNAVSAHGIYRFRWKNIRFHTFIGPSLRFYHGESDPTGFSRAFNRPAPYDFEDPDSGVPDLSVEIPTVGDHLHLNVNAGVGINKKLSKRSDLVLGIRKSWGVRPIGEGSLLIQMHNQLYYGSFSPRANFIGLDVGFKYHLADKSERLAKQNAVAGIPDTSKVRKSFFIEFLGNGGCLTGNFDMRLNPGRNDGLGIRTGIGSGYLYFTGDHIYRYISIPLGLNYIIGKKRSGLESGIGITSGFAHADAVDNSQVTFQGYLNMGYRFQPLKNDLMFRITWSPYLDKSGIIADWGGVSLGYSFK